MKNYVIIGNGVAGASAADKIMAQDSKAKITIFSEEEAPYYYRPRLPEYISGQAELAKFTLHDGEYYASKGVDLRMGSTVESVDTNKRVVKTADGQFTGYDELLLAAGAHPFIPPVDGADKEGVMALRTYADARQIVSWAKRTDSAILVGGGLLGLEAGAALAKRGLKVKVVEFFDRLLPRQMDPAGAAKLQQMLEGMGFEFYLGKKSQQITGDEMADGLSLESGEHLEGGMILFSAGVRPNLELAQQIGLDIDKAVKVDDRMRTSVEGVWAAGDVVEHDGRFYGIWPASQAQGAVAGQNMAGGDAVYSGTVMSNQLKVVGVDLVAGGDIDADGKLQAAVYQDDGIYRKVVMDDGKIAGFIFFGTTEGAAKCQKAMERNVDASGFAQQMANKNFDFGKLLD